MELQKIIITGASSGLGREIAKKLATKANNLLLLGRSTRRLESLQSEIQDKCGSIRYVSIDFSNQADIDLLISSSLLEGSSILINSAADFGPTKNLLTTSLGDVRKAFQVNVLTPIMLSQRVLTFMIDNSYGRIINIGSTGGLGGYALRTPYSLSKNALISFSKTLNQEIISGEYGENLNIKCFCVCPGPISGERFNKQVKDRAEYKNVSSSDMKEKFTSILGRILSPEEVVSKIMETLHPNCSEEEVILFNKKSVY